MSNDDPLESKNRVTKEALKPVTKAETKLEKELKQLEVENTEAGD
jgi:hypothetical protein